MTLETLATHPLAERLALTLLHFLWQGLAVVGAVVVLTRIFDLHRARALHGLYLAGLIAMAACPLATFALIEPATITVPQVVSSPMDFGLIRTESETLRPMESPASPAVPVLIESAATSDGWASLRAIGLGLWLGGVLVLSLRLVLSAGYVHWLRKTSVPLSPEWTALVGRVARQIGYRDQRRPCVRMSQHVGQAVAVGLLRPMVLLPTAWLTGLDRAVIEAVVAHELAHLRRLDAWSLLLQRVVETLLFYHPAVWWLAHRLRLAREMSCDERAVRATGDGVGYVKALVEVARRRSSTPPPVVAAAFGERTQMRLLQRVRNVLGATEGHTSGNRWLPIGLATAIVPLALIAGLWWLSASPDSAIAQDRDGERAGSRGRGPEVVVVVPVEGALPSAKLDALKLVFGERVTFTPDQSMSAVILSGNEGSVREAVFALKDHIALREDALGDRGRGEEDGRTIQVVRLYHSKPDTVAGLIQQYTPSGSVQVTVRPDSQALILEGDGRAVYMAVRLAEQADGRPHPWVAQAIGFGEGGEGGFRREGDRPRKGEVRREGDRPREGEVRREGDRPREGEVRRDGDPFREGDRDREE